MELRRIEIESLREYLLEEKKTNPEEPVLANDHHLNYCYVYGQYDEGKMVGFLTVLMYEPKYVDRVYITPALRRQQLATRMVEFVRAHSASVMRVNQIGQAFFQKLGFTVDPEFEHPDLIHYEKVSATEEQPE